MHPHLVYADDSLFILHARTSRGTALAAFKIKLAYQVGRSSTTKSFCKSCRKLLPVSESYDGDKFFVVTEGVRMATPLLLALAVIEISDVAFAVDSIPAVRVDIMSATMTCQNARGCTKPLLPWPGQVPLHVPALLMGHAWSIAQAVRHLSSGKAAGMHTWWEASLPPARWTALKGSHPESTLLSEPLA